MYYKNQLNACTNICTYHNYNVHATYINLKHIENKYFSCVKRFFKYGTF